MLKDTWKDKINGVDAINANDINGIAKAVIDIEKNGVGNGGKIVIDSEMSDTSENAVQNKVIKGYVDSKIGDIDAALDELHNYAQSLIGGAK